MKTSKAVISTEEQQVACEEGCWGFRASLSFRRKRGKDRLGGRKGEGRLGRLFWPRVSASAPRTRTPSANRLRSPGLPEEYQSPGFQRQAFQARLLVTARRPRWGQACPRAHILLVQPGPRGPNTPGMLAASLHPSSSQTLLHLWSQRQSSAWRWQKGARPFLPRPLTSTLMVPSSQKEMLKTLT